MAPLLQVALNGSRRPSKHLAIPRSPEELAREARASVRFGARVLHLHASGASGSETLSAVPCAAALRAVPSACPGIPVSLTTSAGIESDPKRRFDQIASWVELPHLVTANQGEAGILELCQFLMSRGVGIEAGLLRRTDAEAFVRSGIATRCVRVLVEPLDPQPAQAVATAAAIGDILAAAGVLLEQVHHGDGVASWSVCERALSAGHGIRTGLEDTTVLPDGRQAADNAELVRAAVQMIQRRCTAFG